MTDREPRRFSDPELIALEQKVDELSEKIERVEFKLDQLEQSTSGVIKLFNEGAIGKKWLVRLGIFIMFISSVYLAVKDMVFK